MSLTRLRSEKYTGENRCVKCTTVNLGLLAALTVAVSVLIATPVGFVVAVVGLVTIYLKGYLFPGTPALTKRYLPSDLYRWFRGPEPPAEPEVDPQRWLAEHDVVKSDEESIQMQDWMRNAISESVTDSEDQLTEDVAAMLSVGADRVSCEEFEGRVIVTVDGIRVGDWTSRTALRTDIAIAATYRAQLSDWDDLSTPQQSPLLTATRSLLDRCPHCGDEVTVVSEEVETCCDIEIRDTFQCRSCQSVLLRV